MNQKGELIALTLTNIVEIDSEVNLLSYGGGGGNSNNSPFDTYYQVGFPFSAGLRYGIAGNVGITPIGYTTTPVTDTNDLISQLNSLFATYAVFSLQVDGSIPSYTMIIEILNESFIPNMLVGYSGFSIVLNIPIANPIETIAGSTVSVTTEGGITYNELLSELQNQPYIISSVNIYTNTQAQSLQRFRKTQKEANGVSLIEFERPKLDPMQNQFAIEGIETKFTPSPLNALNYIVKGNETVRMWLYYKMIDMSVPRDIPPINNVSPKKNDKMIIKQSINPFFDLVGITNVKKINIKEDIKKDVKLRNDITDEEVYNSFDGLDYKNIKK